MIIKITYPFKDTPNSINLKDIYIQTDDNELIQKLSSTTNPVDIGVILSDYTEKYKTIPPQTPDIDIEINEVLTDPKLREKFNL